MYNILIWKDHAINPNNTYAVKENPDAANANALLAKLYENMGAKAHLICRVFGDAFTPEELMDSLTPAELNGVLNAIVSAK